MPRTASSDLTAKLAGEAVRDARRRAGLTQVELAERMHVNPSYVAGIETGRRNMTVAQLGNIAQALDARLVVELQVLDDEPLVIARPDRRAMPTKA
jgi:uncharacterized protein